MKTKRILALFLAVVTCLSLAVSASAASISDFKDVDTKAWYAEAVTAAVDNGLLYGKSKTQLDPNGLLTRAEMAAITNRSFGCYKTADISAYKDVAKSKWYYNDVALAVQMGTYNGVSSTSMQPDRAITRQEAIAVVARALQLNLDDYTKTDLSKFADAKEVSKWALPYMKAMVAAGYVHGRTQGLVPQANITRAEFAQLYFNIIQSYITKSGSYTKDYKGNLLVRTKDVELKNMTIDGDLIIGNGVADGKVTLSNVKSPAALSCGAAAQRRFIVTTAQQQPKSLPAVWTGRSRSSLTANRRCWSTTKSKPASPSAQANSRKPRSYFTQWMTS